MKNGTTKSCGCYNTEIKGMQNLIHGLTYHPIWRTYESMKTRCYNPHAAKYERYGARGIKVCDEWKNDFLAFYTWSIANGWKEGLSIDRIDNDGDYEPSNCRWSNSIVQANNKSTNRFVTYNGKTQSVAQWGKEVGINPATLYYRLNAGWSIENTLTTPVKRVEK